MSAKSPAGTPSILLFTELYPPAVGGTAVLFANVYSRVRSAKVCVVTDPQTSAGARANAALDVEFLEISSRFRGVLGRGEARHHLRSGRALRDTARRRHAIVHCGRPLPEGLVALAASRGGFTAPEYVCWAHGEDLAAALTSREHGFLARRVCRRARALLASSRFASTMYAGVGIDPATVQVIHPGVDLERFANVRPAAHVERVIAGRSPVLLSVGRLQRRKGHDLAIEAVASLKADFPRLVYLIAGTGIELDRLKGIARDRGVEDRVVFLGEVPDDDLPGLYAACDIFLMPTRQEQQDVEGFGIVYLEAAAAAKPVIGGRNGGVPEAVADGRTGLLISGTDVAELAQAIRTLAASPEQRRRMGTEGRERVEREFTWDRAAEKLDAFHRRLTDG